LFGPGIQGEDDNFTPPPWLMAAIETNLREPVPVPKASEIRFDTSEGSLDFNTRLLERYEFDFEKLLAGSRGTTIDFGSEFRPLASLKAILGGHTNFEFFAHIITKGMSYVFTRELSEEERTTELAANVERGNHKSANDAPTEVTRLLGKDVKHGFSFPIRPHIISKIKGAFVQPCGMVRQFGLTSSGTRELKERLTQDLSYSCSGEGLSVNDRIDMDSYTEMVYGWCLSRVIHFIVALRLAHPTTHILISKYDFSDAYRRVTHLPSAAVQSIIIFAKVAYVALRLTFGGSPNPPTWCAFLEMVTDLSNETPLCGSWDPGVTKSPIQPTAPAPAFLDPGIPFAEGRSMAVHIPVTSTGRSDCFIDDIIKIFLAISGECDWQTQAVPLAVYVTTRPHAGDSEPIPRRENISVPKLIAEGAPAEDQIVLGWCLETRRLVIKLLGDKFIAWTSDVSTVLSTGKTTFTDLKSLVGRLNHAVYVTPLSRHFMNRLRLRLKKRTFAKQELTLSKAELADLELWLEFLKQAWSGISMNLLTIRRPSRIGVSDSCPYELGGFS
jgi:hypothetical protein